MWKRLRCTRCKETHTLPETIQAAICECGQFINMRLVDHAALEAKGDEIIKSETPRCDAIREGVESRAADELAATQHAAVMSKRVRQVYDEASDIKPEQFAPVWRHGGCEAYQANDQMICGHCGLQWDVNDAIPPQCGKQAAALLKAAEKS